MAIRRGHVTTAAEIAELSALVSRRVHFLRIEFGDRRADKTVAREVLAEIRMVDLSGPLQRLRQMDKNSQDEDAPRRRRQPRAKILPLNKRPA